MIERLLDKGVIKRPLVVNLALSFPGTLPATPNNILLIVRQLPEDFV